MTEEEVRTWLIDNDELLGLAIAQIMERVARFLAAWGDTYEFSAEDIAEARIKEAPRILAKAERHGVTDPSALMERCHKKDGRDRFPVHDLLGVRILVLSLNDVAAVKEAVESLREGAEGAEEGDYSLGNFDDYDLEDINEDPREGGYRALHVDGSVSVRIEADVFVVPFEIQIKTLAQHVYGEHSHDESYVPDEANKDPRYGLVRGLQAALAEQLNAADLLLAELQEVAGDVRDGILSQEVGDDLTALSVTVAVLDRTGIRLRLDEASEVADAAQRGGLETKDELADFVDPARDAAAEFADAFQAEHRRRPSGKEAVVEMVKRLSAPSTEERLAEPTPPNELDNYEPGMVAPADNEGEQS